MSSPSNRVTWLWCVLFSLSLSAKSETPIHPKPPESREDAFLRSWIDTEKSAVIPDASKPSAETGSKRPVSELADPPKKGEQDFDLVGEKKKNPSVDSKSGDSAKTSAAEMDWPKESSPVKVKVTAESDGLTKGDYYLNAAGGMLTFTNANTGEAVGLKGDGVKFFGPDHKPVPIGSARLPNTNPESISNFFRSGGTFRLPGGGC